MWGNFSAAAMTTRASERVPGSDIRLIRRTPKSLSMSRASPSRRKSAKALRRLRKFAANDRFEQFVLGVEIGIERAFGDACSAGDVVHARAVEPGAQEHLTRALHDLTPFGAAVVDRASVPLQRLRLHTEHTFDHKFLTEPFGSISLALRARIPLSQRKMTERFGHFCLKVGFSHGR